MEVELEKRTDKQGWFLQSAVRVLPNDGEASPENCVYVKFIWDYQYT